MEMYGQSREWIFHIKSVTEKRDAEIISYDGIKKVTHNIFPNQIMYITTSWALNQFQQPLRQT